MGKISIHAIRQEYTMASLEEANLDPHPLQQFEHWFNQAVEAKIEEPNAMVLSTLGEHNDIHARMVLLKGISQGGLQFFTNHQSAKGKDIAHQSKVSLLFFWKEIQRQIRIEGLAEKISDEESEIYFKTRPKESQLGAWASHQSEPLNNREELDKRFAELKQKYEHEPVPKPPFWGGYTVKPTYVEFWQGRESRLHDRLAYKLVDNKWNVFRLNP